MPNFNRNGYRFVVRKDRQLAPRTDLQSNVKVVNFARLVVREHHEVNTVIPAHALDRVPALQNQSFHMVDCQISINVLACAPFSLRSSVVASHHTAAPALDAGCT